MGNRVKIWDLKIERAKVQSKMDVFIFNPRINIDEKNKKLQPLKAKRDKLTMMIEELTR